MPASGPDREEDGKDEAIVPTDLSLINDDDLKEAFAPVCPCNVLLTRQRILSLSYFSAYLSLSSISSRTGWICWWCATAATLARCSTTRPCRSRGARPAGVPLVVPLVVVVVWLLSAGFSAAAVVAAQEEEEAAWCRRCLGPWPVAALRPRTAPWTSTVWPRSLAVSLSRQT